MIVADRLSPRDELQRLNDEAAVDFLARREEERSSLYQTHLRCGVRYAAPLLIEAVEAEGRSLVEVVSEMAPAPDWPRRLGASPWPQSAGRALGHFKPYRGTLGNQRFLRRLQYGGAILRMPSHPMGAFGVWVSGDALFARIDLGTASLVIAGGDAWLRLPPGLPETAIASLAGRSLDRIVAHPLLDARDYVVRNVHHPDADTPPALGFRCGLVEIDLLDAGVPS